MFNGSRSGIWLRTPTLLYFLARNCLTQPPSHCHKSSSNSACHLHHATRYTLSKSSRGRLLLLTPAPPNSLIASYSTKTTTLKSTKILSHIPKTYSHSPKTLPCQVAIVPNII